MTLNEPQVYIGMGHGTGEHAPGLKLDLAEVLRAAHNTLLAHGKAVQVIRSRSRGESFVGHALVGSGAIPASDDPADIEAARIYSTRILTKSWWNNTWWSDPIFFGSYPQDGLDILAADAPQVLPGDMETIQQPVDFYGVNIYQAPTVRAGEDGLPVELLPPDGVGLTSFPWPVTPEALYWTPKFIYERYATPMYITENGMANNDWVALDGKVHDPQRIDFTQRYLRSLRRAINDGVDMRGYFHWSIMDNYEWAKGYNLRFGLVYVDYATQQRILKDSAVWYKGVIAANGANI
jgi:beta-glucosidase